MNSKQANAVKELAAPVNKVLEELEWDCPECEGYGHRIVHREDFRIIHGDWKPRPCSTCNGTGKIKYSWTPQVGEWCYNERMGSPPELISEVDLSRDTSIRVGQYIWTNPVFRTPILEWKTIEEILEKAGYYFEEPIKRVYGSEGSKCHCVIKKLGNPKPVGVAWADSRIRAVYEAIKELGKEQAKKKGANDEPDKNR